MTIFGQIVIGPPGSGKTTYCKGMCDFLRQIGRPAYVVNFDPANESLEAVYGTAEDDDGNDDNETPTDPTKLGLSNMVIFDVMSEVISLSSVMERFNLGPNGGLIYCMEYISKHLDEVVSKMVAAIEEAVGGHEGTAPPYLLFDFPGQVELYTHNTSVQSLIERMTSSDMDYRLTLVTLIDAHHCTDAGKFISSVLLATTTMLRIQLPAVNVLSKVDLLEKFGEAQFNLEFFTDVMDLGRLLEFLDNPSQKGQVDEGMDISGDAGYQQARTALKSSAFYRKHRKLHEALVEVIDDFGLVKFYPLNIEDASSVGRVVGQVDKCNGYIFGSVGEFKDLEGGGANLSHLFKTAVQVDAAGSGFEQLAEVSEKFLPGMFKEDIVVERNAL
jgi:GTPase SAR1 family protein